VAWGQRVGVRVGKYHKTFVTLDHKPKNMCRLNC
jgi:hypothetical protein